MYFTILNMYNMLEYLLNNYRGQETEKSFIHRIDCQALSHISSFRLAVPGPAALLNGISSPLSSKLPKRLIFRRSIEK